jgi:hypothetical protein
MKLASNMINDDYGESDMNILDDHYKRLNCKIEAIDKSHSDWKLIADYVKNTHASTHSQYSLEPLDIYRVERPDEEKKYKKNLGNDMLLWHGSGTANYVGILSQGLRIAPPEAPVSGYMFGKGIYLADMVSKSANYCRTGPGNNIGCLLLCEAAMGNMNEKLFADCHSANLPSGKHSTKGVGRNAPPPSSYVKHGRC